MAVRKSSTSKTLYHRVTPLHCAAINGHLEVVKILLENGADVNRACNVRRTGVLLLTQCNLYGITALHRAVLKRHADIVKLLLEKGAHIHQAQKDGMTPLMLAEKCGKVQVVQVLLEAATDMAIAPRANANAPPQQQQPTAPTPPTVSSVLPRVTTKDSCGQSSLFSEVQRDHRGRLQTTSAPPIAFGPTLFASLAANPRTRTFLNDPDFVRKLVDMQERPHSIHKYASDPRMAIVLDVLETSDPFETQESTSSAAVELQPMVQDNVDVFDLTGLRKYRIDRDDVQCSRNPVGRGGFGAVYFGQWLGDSVAIKKLSQYIVAFKDAVWTRPMDIMLVMEWMDEGELNHFLACRRPQDVAWRERVQIAHDIAQALTHLHSLSNIHRDLKTRYVLLTPKWRAKLTDFGIARRAAGASQQEMTAGIGTTHWMAPEVMRGGQHDKSADVYAMGVLLFVLDTHDMQVMTGAAAPEFASFQTTSSSAAFSSVAPMWYIELSRKCIAWTAAERPSARQVAFQLEQQLDDTQLDGSVGLAQLATDVHTMKLV
ncbi:Aste57867_1830 [Aphanomyces stellatus]|uniref:Aste57867_1830 protein n=1 Tax=Aphanomyces stellatus TaxID=120398 RepID=A0A485K7D0_9STRA|nr:hypothetical protein As57867_001828 [Aphanomyces stellatus]VFT79038.1 Aste57867_1830 [Aphanomyces stellatus]